MDPFKICIYKLWKTGELMYYVLAMLFGTSPLSTPRGYYYSNLRILTHVHYMLWSWNRRFSRICNRCGDSEEIKDPGWGSGHAKSLGYYSTRCDAILHVHILGSSFVSNIFVRHPGRWYPICLRATGRVMLIAPVCLGERSTLARNVGSRFSTSREP